MTVTTLEVSCLCAVVIVFAHELYTGTGISRRAWIVIYLALVAVVHGLTR